MNIFRFPVLASFFFIIFSNCKKENTEPPTNNHIQFETTSVGQKSKYALFYMENIDDDSDTALKQTTDTVTLIIFGKRDSIFWIKEELNDSNTLPSQYNFSIKNDAFDVDQGQGLSIGSGRLSELFHYSSYNHILNSNNLPKWAINSWGRPKNTVVAQKHGSCNSIKVLGKTYKDVIIYHNSENGASEPSWVYIYSKKDGIISIQYLDEKKSKRGTIYNLIPD